jgi:hypothetical protein
MVNPLWHQRCGPKTQRCPPIVAHEVRALDTEMVQYPDDVANEGREGVLVDPFRLVGGAEAAKVGDDDLEPSFSQHRDLLAPQTPGVGKAVEHDYGLAFSMKLDRDTYTVDIDARL